MKRVSSPFIVGVPDEAPAAGERRNRAHKPDPRRQDATEWQPAKKSLQERLDHVDEARGSAARVRKRTSLGTIAVTAASIAETAAAGSLSDALKRQGYGDEPMFQQAVLATLASVCPSGDPPFGRFDLVVAQAKRVFPRVLRDLERAERDRTGEPRPVGKRNDLAR